MEFGKHLQRGAVYGMIVFAIMLTFMHGMTIAVNGITMNMADVNAFPSPYWELLISFACGLAALGIEWSKAEKEEEKPKQ